MSSSMARSSFRLVTSPATAVPSELEVRFSPLVSRCHQLRFGVSAVVSFMAGVLAVSSPKRKPRRLIQVPELTPAEIQARVLHRDGLMLVIDKPAGLPVHRGPKGGPNLEASFDALRFGLPRPPVLAHRLDRDTSGCLVLGRHRKATASLGLLFKHGKISKTYWAVVEDGPAEDEGTIELPLGRKNAERGWWQKPDPDGQKAVTNWKVLGRGEGLAWLAMEPVTGRTHQLRVHASAMGWPIVGDNIYGNGPRFGEPRLHLHSRELVIPISRNKDPVRVVAPAPEHMHERLKMCGWKGE
jgi:tRNA pseudouridine32 synthase / 23S rRNA pseudouridine746 synthase